MTLNELIERISFIRNRANLSARKLSMLIGKTEGYIHHMEQSKNFAPTFETLSDILEVCNTTFEEFFYKDISSYKKDKELLDLIQNSTDSKKDIAISILKLKWNHINTALHPQSWILL